MRPFFSRCKVLLPDACLLHDRQDDLFDAEGLSCAYVEEIETFEGETPDEGVGKVGNEEVIAPGPEVYNFNLLQVGVNNLVDDRGDEKVRMLPRPININRSEDDHRHVIGAGIEPASFLCEEFAVVVSASWIHGVGFIHRQVPGGTIDILTYVSQFAAFFTA